MITSWSRYTSAPPIPPRPPTPRDRSIIQRELLLAQLPLRTFIPPSPPPVATSLSISTKSYTTLPSEHHDRPSQTLMSLPSAPAIPRLQPSRVHHLKHLLPSHAGSSHRWIYPQCPLAWKFTSLTSPEGEWAREFARWSTCLCRPKII